MAALSANHEIHLSMGFNLAIFKMSADLTWPILIILWMSLFIKMLQMTITLTIMSYESSQAYTIVGVILCKKHDKRDRSMFKCNFDWKQVKYARTMITHVCSSGSLGRCLNTWSSVQTASLGLSKC